MIRRIIEIDQDKCTGCGACAQACHEGAIAMVDGKAKLMRDDYCDGLGDCLPACPTGAIRFTEREAEAYNEAAVLAAKAEKEKLLSEIERIDKKLANEGFDSKAPSAVIEGERKKRDAYADKLASVEASLVKFQK